jgi:hypothetical protein
MAEAYEQGNHEGTNKFAVPNSDFRYANRGQTGAVGAHTQSFQLGLIVVLRQIKPAINCRPLCVGGIKSRLFNANEHRVAGNFPGSGAMTEV